MCAEKIPFLYIEGYITRDGLDNYYVINISR